MRLAGLLAAGFLSVFGSGTAAGEPGLRLAPCDGKTCVVAELAEGLAAALAGREVPADAWGRALSVRTASAAASDPPGPTLFGEHRLEGRRLRFAPRLPFLPGDEYVAAFDPGALRRLAGGAAAESRVEELRFRLERPAREPPRVLAIHPATGDVPANLLRAYVQFSAPMRPDVAAEHLRLVDDRGREVELPFVEVPGGLWDPGGTRLTLLFHPGRIKRGVAPRETLGPPLEEGRSYRLIVAAGWPAATGEALVESVEKSWRVGSEDRAAVAPERWTLAAPPAGTREPLVARLGEALDHALAQRLVTVLRDGNPVLGRAELAADGAEWRFQPRAPWSAEEHVLRVDPDLEDLAGNRVGRLFDRGPGERAEDQPEPVDLPFRPRPTTAR